MLNVLHFIPGILVGAVVHRLGCKVGLVIGAILSSGEILDFYLNIFLNVLHSDFSQMRPN